MTGVLKENMLEGTFAAHSYLLQVVQKDDTPPGQLEEQPLYACLDLFGHCNRHLHPLAHMPSDDGANGLDDSGAIRGREAHVSNLFMSRFNLIECSIAMAVELSNQVPDLTDL